MREVQVEETTASQTRLRRRHPCRCSRAWPAFRQGNTACRLTSPCRTCRASRVRRPPLRCPPPRCSRGPTTIPSRAVTNSSRWMTFMNLTRIVWHEDIGVGRGLTEKCVIDSDALRACSGYVSICSHVSSRDSRDSAGCNFLAWFGFHSCYGGLSCVTNICRLSRRSE